MCIRDRLYTFDLAQEWIRDGIYKVEGFVTHHFKLDDYKAAFRLALENSCLLYTSRCV